MRSRIWTRGAVKCWSIAIDRKVLWMFKNLQQSMLNVIQVREFPLVSNDLDWLIGELVSCRGQ